MNARIAYAIEFLLAIIAFLMLWSQAGGQGHLDLMAWYWKAGFTLGVAFAVVKATAAAVEAEQPWTARSLRWLIITVMLLALAGVVTYYHHLYEPDEGEDDVAALIDADEYAGERA